MYENGHARSRLVIFCTACLMILATAACTGAAGPGRSVTSSSHEAAAATHAPPSIEQLLRITTPQTGARLADGSYLFLDWTTGITQLYHRNGVQLTRLTDFIHGVSCYRLAPDHRTVLVQTDHAGDEQFDIHRIDLADGRISPLLVNPAVRYDCPLWLPDSSGFIYAATEPNPRDFTIYHFDLATGARRIEVNRPGANWPVAVSPDGRRFAYLVYRSQNDTDGYLKTIGAAGDGDALYRSDGAASFIPQGFLADGRALATTNRGSDLDYLVVMDARPSPVMVEYRRFDWPLEQVSVSPDGSVVAIVLNEDGRSRLLLQRHDGAALPTPDLPPGLIAVTQLEDDGMVLSHQSGASANRVISWRFVSGSDPAAEVVAMPDYCGVDPTLFREPVYRTVTSFDGLSIPVLMYLPDGPGPHPFIIYAHGGPSAQSRPSFSRTFQYLLMHGFGVAAPNVRGSTGYGKAFEDADNYRKRMDSVADLKATVDALVAQGVADPTRMAVIGGSYGGFMVMAAITEYPDLFQAAVSSVGIADFVNFLRRTKSYRQSLRESEYGPLSDEEFLRSISPINKLDAVRTPLFLVHGRNDPRVPVSEAEAIHQRLTALGRPVELLIFEDEGHGVEKLENRLVYYPRMLTFINKHLAAKPAEHLRP